MKKNLLLTFALICALITPALEPIATAQNTTAEKSFEAMQSRFTPHTGIDAALWEKSDAFVKTARLNYAHGQYDLAEQVCKEAAEAAPGSSNGEKLTNPNLVNLLSRIYFHVSRNADIINLLEKIPFKELIPENQIELLIAYTRTGKYNLALKYYSSLHLRDLDADCIESDKPGIDTPEKLQATLLLDRVYEMSYNAPDIEATFDLEKASNLAPNNPIIASCLAAYYSKVKMRDKEIPYLNIVAKYGHGRLLSQAQARLKELSAL
jgi:tetratricopeptide (TPR) repeat protein